MPSIRLVRFVLVGLSNTAIGLLVIFACKGYLGLGDIESNLLGYGMGILLGFALNKHWTFGHVGRMGPAFARYLLVLALAYVVNLATTVYAIDILALNSYVAHAIGVIPYGITGYLGSRHFAFSHSKVSK
jgi:putative flippase GtrA